MEISGCVRGSGGVAVARDGGWEVQSGPCRWLDSGLLRPLGWLMLSGASIGA